MLPHLNSCFKGAQALWILREHIERQPLIDVRDTQGLRLMSGPTQQWEPSFMLQGITFAYPSKPSIAVLKDVNLFIAPGKFTALVGPSGGGKSTIAALLLRLYDPKPESNPKSDNKKTCMGHWQT
jgi:ATP-binding cassette, subfamily B (MDR/TAP), member 1